MDRQLRARSLFITKTAKRDGDVAGELDPLPPAPIAGSRFQLPIKASSLLLHHRQAFKGPYTAELGDHFLSHFAMSSAVWPPIDDMQLGHEQAQSQARELDWLLVQLRDTLQSLKAGLEECAALLAPSENASTLVLSSLRSESLKGLVTRIGTRIVKGVSRLAVSELAHPLITILRTSSCAYPPFHHQKAPSVTTLPFRQLHKHLSSSLS